MKNHKDIFDDFTEVTERGKRSKNPFIRSGNAKMQLKQYEEAIEDYSSAIEIDPNNAGYYCIRGVAKIYKDNILRRFAYIFTSETDSNMKKALEKYINLGDYQNAESFWIHGLEQYPEMEQIYEGNIPRPLISIFNTESYWQKALGKYKNSTGYQDALKDFAKAIELDPHNPKFYFCRGSIRGDLSDCKEAIDDFSKAIEIDPNNADFYQRRGWSKTDLGDYQGVIEDFTRAIKLDPYNDDFYSYRASAKRILGDTKGADKDDKKAKKLKKYGEKV